MRNSLIHLLEIFELLLDEPATFHRIRTKVGIGFNPLKKLLEKLLEDELLNNFERGGKVYYEATHKMLDIFKGSFYSGLSELSNRDKKLGL